MMRTFWIAGLLSVLPAWAIAQNVELKVGDPAPEFKPQETDGKTHQLSDYPGKETRRPMACCTNAASPIAERFISTIEKTIRPETSAEDMPAQLAELKVSMVKTCN